MLNLIRMGRMNHNFTYLKRYFAFDPTRRSSPHKEFFAVNENLQRKRGENSPLIIYLEGPLGGGKKAIIDRLSHIGYTTVYVPFIPLLLQDLHKPIEEVRTYWRNLLIKSVENERAKKRHKDNVVFVHRSPLCMEQITEILSNDQPLGNDAVVFALPDPIVMKQRVAQRIYLANHEEQDVRRKLGEEDESTLDHSLLTFSKLASEYPNKYHSIFSTSVKQGQAQLLRLIGITPSLFSQVAAENHFKS